MKLQVQVFLLLIGHWATALDCGYPGVPLGGMVNLTVDPASTLTYPPGTAVSYICRDKSQRLRGANVRVCGSAGRWSASRGWCETNLAYGRTINYKGPGHENLRRLTDGSTITSKDMCLKIPGSKNLVQPLTLNLNGSHPVRGVVFHLADSKEYFLNDRVTLVGPKQQQCWRRFNSAANHPHIAVFQCMNLTDDVKPDLFQGNQIRLQHLNTHPVRLCEIEVYSNPKHFECGLPEIPSNGKVKIAYSESLYEVASYHCNEGYRMVGQSKRQCFGRHWIGKQPICVKAEHLLRNETEVGNEPNDSSQTDDDQKGDLNSIDFGPDWELVVNRTMEEQVINLSEYQSNAGIFIALAVVASVGLVVTGVFLTKRGRQSSEAKQGEINDRIELLENEVPSYGDPIPQGCFSHPVRKVYQVLRNV